MQTAPPNRPKTSHTCRYYLWADDGPWKIPVKLHHDLAAGLATLPQYAETLQKILEVDIRRSGNVQVTRFRGTIYSFNEQGGLDLAFQAEAVGAEIESALPLQVQETVLDIGPLLRKKRLKRERTWIPTPAMRQLISSDINRHATSRPIRVLRLSGKGSPR